MIPVKLGYEFSRTRVLAITEGQVELSRKIETGNGVSLRASERIYGVYKNFLLGGGVSATKLVTTEWSKGTINPVIGVGYAWSTGRVIEDYKFGTDKYNKVSEYQTSIQAMLSQHWIFTTDLEIVRYRTTFQLQLPVHTGVVIGPGIKYVF